MFDVCFCVTNAINNYVWKYMFHMYKYIKIISDRRTGSRTILITGYLMAEHHAWHKSLQKIVFQMKHALINNKSSKIFKKYG